MYDTEISVLYMLSEKQISRDSQCGLDADIYAGMDVKVCIYIVRNIFYEFKKDMCWDNFTSF